MNDKKDMRQGSFNRLRLDELRRYGGRWASDAEKMGIVVEKITLYHYGPKPDYLFPNPKQRYAVVFEFPDDADFRIDEFKPLANKRTGKKYVFDEYEKISLFSIMTFEPPVSYQDYIIYLLQYHIAFRDRDFRELFDDSFLDEVYFEKPPEDYRQEWIFLPMKNGQVPNADWVKTDEACEILYTKKIKKIMTAKTRIENENFFPELIIPNLKVLYVEDWINKYQDIPIDRVTLYHYEPDSHDYMRYRRGDKGRNPAKYSIIFDFSDEADLSGVDFLQPLGGFNKLINQDLPPDASISELLEAAASKKTNSCIEFIRARCEYPEFSSGRYFGLLNSSFASTVYHRAPAHNFYDDWTFLPRWRDRVSLMESAGRIKTDKPHCVLFERNNVIPRSQSSQPDNLDEKMKTDILKKAGTLSIAPKICKPYQG